MSCAALTGEFIDGLSYSRENGNDLSELSKGGTVFLDDVHELPPTSQSKLLHVLPDGGVSQQRCLGERQGFPLPHC